MATLYSPVHVLQPAGTFIDRKVGNLTPTAVPRPRRRTDGAGGRDTHSIGVLRSQRGLPTSKNPHAQGEGGGEGQGGCKRLARRH